MQAKAIILLLISCAVALGVAFFMRGNDVASDPQTRVLVATMDIAQGSFVQMDKHLQWQPWPEDNLSAQLLVEGKFDANKLNGAVARRELLKGEPIAENALVKTNEGGFMSAVLAPGKRAISIAVDATTGNAGFIFPGDKVDLIITHSIQEKSGEEQVVKRSLASETFIQNVRVLAVDQSLDNPQQTAMLAKTVTLEVSKEQAEKINVAKDLGKISLSLRSLATEDKAETEKEEKRKHYTRESDVSGLLNPEESSKKKVTVIRGDEREEIEFDQRGR